MREMTLEEVKLLELDALKFIDSVCKENGLIYFAAYGTLLGAIRHKGFIPWDDDIDIYMPRPDFIKFVEVINNYEHPYSIRSLNDKDYFHAFAKLSDDRTYLIEKQFKSKSRELGVYVDIFILDGLPDDIKKAQKHFKKCHSLTVILYGFIDNKFPNFKNGFLVYIKSIIVWFMVKILKVFHGAEYIKRLFNKRSQKYSFEQSKLVFPEGCCYGINEIYLKKGFEEERKSKFENLEIRIPSDYDNCLSKCYGDYMQLPPKNKRFATHDFTAFWK